MTDELAAFLSGIGLGIFLLIGGTLLLRFLAIRDMRLREARRRVTPSAEPPAAF